MSNGNDANKEALLTTKEVRNFLSECYSFVRAEITAEELRTFGVADQIAARLRDLEGSKKEASDFAGLTRMGRVEKLKKMTGKMVEFAKTLEVDDTEELTAYWQSNEGTLGVDEEVIVKAMESIIKPKKTTKDSALTITEDGDPNTLRAPINR
jgi:hypothetical protein